MGFWTYLFVWVGSAILGALLRPRSVSTVGAPGTLEDFNFPTAEESRPLPVAWGTVRLDGPNVLWYGNLTATAFQINVPDTPIDVPGGYKYQVTVQYALCHGVVDDILEVRFDDRVAAFSSTPIGSGDGKKLTFNLPLFYGGEGAGNSGGIGGDIDVYFGTLTQVANDYLVTQLGNLPAYRGLSYAVLRHFYVGNQSTMRTIAFVIRRTPNPIGLTSNHHNISGDANPACMLYEVLTDQRWGLGISPGLIDLASFVAAGDTLFTEGFGLSMVLDGQTDGTEVLRDLLRHIDAVLFTDPTTGLITLRLVRADYTPSSLPIYDESQIRSCVMTRRSWDDTRNTVKIRYRDRMNGYTDRVASAQDLSNVQKRGLVAVEDLAFRGIPNGTIAAKVAARELVARAYPAASFELEIDRTGWKLRPGSVFRLTWAPLGIIEMVVRVANNGSGELTNGRIPLDVVEDIFAIDWTAYTPPGGPGWSDPVAPPVALVAQRLIESAYALAGGELRKVQTLGVHGAGVYNGYQVWSDPAGGTAYAQTNDVGALTPSSTLTATIDSKANSLTVAAAGVDLDVLQTISAGDLALGRNLLLVDDEWIVWQTVTINGDSTRTFTGLVRGVLDTTPKSHSSGARVWFARNAGAVAFGFTSPTDYLADLTVTAKLLPYNGAGVLAIGSASQVSQATQSRAARPLVPAAILENAVSYPSHIADALIVSWSHRNRLASWEYDDAGVTASPEAGTAYRVKIYGEAGTLLHTESAIAGTSYTYPTATEISESGGLGRLNDELRVTVEAYQTGGAGLISQQVYDHTCDRAGWGMRWGEYWGGNPG